MKNRLQSFRNKTLVLTAGLLGGTALLAQAGKPASDDFPQFVDTAAQAGIVLMNVSGGPDKDYILEANGNGAGFFDYDNDGDMDVLIANGSTLDSYRKGGDPMAALYRNDGGRFTDVTKAAGLRQSGWGMGVCAADYDND